ncbi:DUF6624 domain-containing protein [Flavobacterium piscisymbiosum]|uniref:Uncharacterized protein n=1 Tax=Flavobacterium piscisymbiosum TaxID=2893753 RepID=A0ABS8MJU7_9FLAO|nr:DUF6624 domain-containing protein [Flavobacterium sp. F-30]MCC9065775.1 hypothetical protein [Flavobacterium sp. F-30]
MDNRIAKELIEMARHDLEVREELLKEGKLSPGYNPDMERVHIKNATRLDEIINSIGYPTKSIVGEEASQAAWLIVQHAISLPVFMKKCYTLIAEAADQVSPQNFAYLHDRICYFEGRPQKFGTQFDSRGMYPVENKNEMIRLRKELQLNAHDEKSIVEFIPSVHKIDLHPDDEEFNLWRKQVGWV